MENWVGLESLATPLGLAVENSGVVYVYRYFSGLTSSGCYHRLALSQCKVWNCGTMFISKEGEGLQCLVSMYE